MSGEQSVSGLDQLCAAACGGTGPAPQGGVGEIKVQEIEAYASVADLIHAAILANSGTASLKEIYEVCEQHGRIAYRRADGSRLITSNDHWKSQVRHALYTGGRFERVPSNSDYWQLSTAYRGASAELVRVLVRADDKSLAVRATLSLPPSSSRAAMAAAAAPAPEAAQRAAAPAPASRQRRKRTAGAEASIEAMCDSIDPTTAAGQGARALPRQQGPSLRPRTKVNFDAAPDNHSTQDDDEVQEDQLPQMQVRRRGMRRAVKRTEEMFLGSEEQQHVPAGNNISFDSMDPSTLRWGSTSLRSTIIIAADSSGLSASIVPRGRLLGRAREASAEADSAPKNRFRSKAREEAAAAAAAAAAGTLPPAKRQALPGSTAYFSPPAFTAQQWAEAVQQMEAMAKHAQQNGEVPPQGWVGSMMAMLPAMFAAAAPFFANQQAHQQIQQQMQSVFMNTPAAVEEQQRLQEGAAIDGGCGATVDS